MSSSSSNLSTPSLFSPRAEPPRIRTRALVWLDPAQLEFVARVADLARIEIVAAGSSARGQAASVAASLRAKTVDDLRNALSAGAADESLAWIASAGDFGRDPADVRALQAAAARGVKIVSSEPIPSAVEHLARREWTDPAPTLADPSAVLTYTPRTRSRDPWTEAWDAFLAAQPDIPAVAGTTRLASLHSTCRPDHATLSSLLFDALDIVVGVMGEPESVSASYIPESWTPDRGPGSSAAAPDSLAGLRGDLNLLLDFPDGRAASITLSDRAPTSELRASFLTTNGRLDLTHDGFTWRDLNTAHAPDSHDRSDPARGDGAALTAADLRRALAPTPVPPIDLPLVLSLAQAALLSARTRGPARPAVFLSMLSSR